MSNLNSTNRLTEFPRLEEVEGRPDAGFSFSKFMFWRKGDEIPPVADINYASSSSGQVQSPPPSSQGPSVSVVPPPSCSPTPNINSTGRKISVTIPQYRSDTNLSNPSPELMDGPVSPGGYEARNVSNVLRRLTNLIAMGSNNQADLKKYWMPDSVSKECYECGEKFTTFRRKHHCRICGQIFCSRCCNQEIPGKVVGYSGDLRVCVYCCRIVLSYLRSTDANNEDGTADLKSVQEDLQTHYGGMSNDFVQIGGGTQISVADHSGSYRSLSRRKASNCYQEERFAGTKEHSFDSFNTNGDKPKLVWDWVSLKAMWEEMLHPVTGIDWATHRHNMMKYCHSCVVGSELVDWLLAQRKITWRGQGVQIGQLLIDAHLLECVSQAEQVFVDAYALYKPVQVPLSCVQETHEPESTRNSTDFGDGKDWGQDPAWLKQVTNVEKPDMTEDSSSSSGIGPSGDAQGHLPSTNSYSLDLNLSSSTVSISKPKDATFDDVDVRSPTPSDKIASPSSQVPKGSPTRALGKLAHTSATTETMTDEFLQKTLQSQKEKTTNTAAPMGWHSPHQLTTDGDLRAFQTLCNSFIKHENDMLNQLLDNMGVDASWADVILPIVHKVTEVVRPDVRNADDEMDIRQYIQFKKLPGGKKSDCRIVNGVVCTKNVAHRHMLNRLKDPNILLIGSSIDYQRFENRFLSLEPLVMQENNYLKNTVARIAALKPDIVMVEKTVSRLAQEFMLDQGITLVINVKPSVIERVGRLTQGAIWESADTPIGKPQLGLCHNFYLETFHLNCDNRKTLMFFDGCATHLGCTVLLRGGTHAELIKVKKITSFLMFVAYNWRLERSFHIDSFSMPPEQVQETTLPAAEEGFIDTLENVASPDHSGTELHRSSSTYKTSFHEALEGCILSASPFIKYPIPFLETQEGKSCELRKYFPDVLYCSPQGFQSLILPEVMEDISNNNVSFDPVVLNSKTSKEMPRICWEQPHPFTTTKLTSAINSDEVQGVIANFRRKGSRLELVAGGPFLNSEECVKSDASSWNTVEHDKLKPGQGDEHVDALDPLKHQRLSVLFCSYSPDSENYPYYCVNPWVVNMDMYGRNDISLGMFLERYCFRKSYVCPARQCETPMIRHIRRFVHCNGCIEVFLKELKSPILGSGQSILMWNWCAACRLVSPIVPMSTDGWSLSFAKYLELRFYGQCYTRRGFDNSCQHSLHQHHQHFFAQHNVVAVFQFIPIQLWEITLPKCPISVKKIPKTVAELIEDVKSVAILGHGVYSNIYEALSSLKESSCGLKVEDLLSTLFEQQKTEKAIFRAKIEDVQVSLASQAVTGAGEVDAHLWKVKDSISFVTCNIAETIQHWNQLLSNLIAQKKKEEKQSKDTTSSVKTIPRLDSEPVLPIVKEFEESFGKISNFDTVSVDLSVGGGDLRGATLDGSMNFNSDDREVATTMSSCVLEVPVDPLAVKRSASPSPSPSLCSQRVESDRIKAEDEVLDTSKVEKKSSTMKNLISHFKSEAGAQIIQTPWPLGEHHLPVAYSVIPVTVYESEPSSIVAFTLGSTEYKSKLKQSLGPPAAVLTALSCDENVLAKKTKGNEDTGGAGDFHASVGSLGNKSLPEEKLSGEVGEDKAVLKKGDENIEIQFSSASAKFYCRVYFAEKFRKLRKACLVEGEEFYIRSLARCVSWAASGGKSGSTFCKSTDERFIIKQMSRFEIQSFLDFAPNYFEYMKAAFADNRPTVLVKIMGVYRIGFKNFQTNTAIKMDILVMENLFYQKTITQKFDLKGSIRNRLANVTGKDQEDLVLLDENLVNMACENPMYIRPHTKTVLSLALSNDSKFLASQMVMDYSLLVGLDEKNAELVVGIIDYIRTFTWDKKIETFVKSSGILGGQGKTPTVVSPSEYQSRFCEAMDRYFLLVPDRWLGLGLGLEA